uniref:Uncharacterized protein n=1 Tax=Aegilops tauschii subsp. strangulata TaxID=200361 RepID=A0A453SAH0_AEGTS
HGTPHQRPTTHRTTSRRQLASDRASTDQRSPEPGRSSLGAQATRTRRCRRARPTPPSPRPCPASTTTTPPSPSPSPAPPPTTASAPSTTSTTSLPPQSTRPSPTFPVSRTSHDEELVMYIHSLVFCGWFLTWYVR